MKPEPLHLIVARVLRMPLAERADHLADLANKEKWHSVRKNELLSLAEGQRRKQLRRENRAA